MKMVMPLEVGICCRDLEKLSKFYIDVLECRPVSVIDVAAERARSALLSGDAYRVARLQTPWGERLKLLQPTAKPIRAKRTNWILDRQNAIYLTFIVDDLELLVRRLQLEGVQLLTGKTPVEIRTGVWLAFARDPEGNILEFVRYDAVSDYREERASSSSQVR